MPNFAKVFKEEITRLARKEVRTALEKASRATAQHRREIVYLKSQVAAMGRQVAALEKQAQKTGGAPACQIVSPHRGVPDCLTPPESD